MIHFRRKDKYFWQGEYGYRIALFLVKDWKRIYGVYTPRRQLISLTDFLMPAIKIASMHRFLSDEPKPWEKKTKT